jgi:diacylglycerol kinase
MSADRNGDRPGSWRRKFGCALRGCGRGVRGQSSFAVHLLAAVGVIAAAAVLRCEPWQWAVLVLCITIVLAAEMFNTAIEALARAVRREHDPHLADALDIGSAAVLVAAVGAAVVGVLVFAHRAGQWASYW